MFHYKNVFLTEESEGSGESMKYRSGDPILGKNFFFPVSNCHTTRTPSFPPIKIQRDGNRKLYIGWM